MLCTISLYITSHPMAEKENSNIKIHTQINKTERGELRCSEGSGCLCHLLKTVFIYHMLRDNTVLGGERWC